MKDGQKLVFHGEGDHEPGLEPGDVIIVLDQKENEVYQRQDDNLIMKMTIQLVEALCGFKRTIETMDGRTLLIGSHPGQYYYAQLMFTIIVTEARLTVTAFLNSRRIIYFF